MLYLGTREHDTVMIYISNNQVPGPSIAIASVQKTNNIKKNKINAVFENIHSTLRGTFKYYLYLIFYSSSHLRTYLHQCIGKNENFTQCYLTVQLNEF